MGKEEISEKMRKSCMAFLVYLKIRIKGGVYFFYIK